MANQTSSQTYATDFMHNQMHVLATIPTKSTVLENAQ